ncbi:MAG TPA: ATP-dependent helicase [Spirochaetaceae bacterium]|nr:ATP-dependent helicase [Spirochaetaceae bacterium]
MNEFSTLGLHDGLAEAFGALGFKVPTKVQRLAIPRILIKKDIFLQSETGTGKTFAYLAPAISFTREMSPTRGPLILVLCPTQELAVQVARQAEALLEAAHIPMNVLAILGGSPLSRQEDALKKRKPHIVIGTPGRISDLAKMRFLRLDSLNFLVLDEGDRLLSAEYRDQVKDILDRAPSSSCRILASATISPNTRKIARAFMKEPESLDLLDEGVLARDIEHWIFYVEHRKRIDFIRRLETALRPKKCLVFASSGDRVARTAERLVERGLPSDSIASKQEKEHRRVAIERFESGSLRYLVTTDLGARGLDISGITHIISMDMPEEGSWYIHRAGRTGRAGEKGLSIVLADARELKSAAKVAVERNFVFRTKRLEGGSVVEPPVDEFFEFVEKGEAEKKEYREKARSERKESAQR